MKGGYKAALAFLPLLIFVPLTLTMTPSLWVLTSVGIRLPVGTHTALDESPRLTRHGLHIPELRYLVEDYPLACITRMDLSHPSRWALDIGTIELDSACPAKLPQAGPSSVAPKTLAEWQSMLPNTQINIDKFTLSSWQEWQGKLSPSLTLTTQQLRYQGEKVRFQGRLHGRNPTVTELDAVVFEGQSPVELAGELTMPLVPDGLSASDHMVATLSLSQESTFVGAELE